MKPRTDWNLIAFLILAPGAGAFSFMAWVGALDLWGAWAFILTMAAAGLIAGVVYELFSIRASLTERHSPRGVHPGRE